MAKVYVIRAGIYLGEFKVVEVESASLLSGSEPTYMRRATAARALIKQCIVYQTRLNSSKAEARKIVKEANL